MHDQPHDNNRASAVLAKIGHGHADLEFARAAAKCVARATETGKKAKLTCVVTFDPDADKGCVSVRAEVSTKLPRLPSPGSQMHIGPEGQLMTQMEFLFDGGPKGKPQPLPQTGSAGSGRLTVARPAAPAPLAVTPAPVPLAVGQENPNKYGKEAAAKDD